jgi:tRNA pseudouridine32 synthase/23S rRNA pseudouridine746 synthase
VHGNHSNNTQPQIITSEVDDKSAKSTFSCLNYDTTKDQSLIQVKIESGRKHQIRIHAASIGLPIVGDRLHGIANNNEPMDLQLCAVSLRFNCPMTLQQQCFELPDRLRPHL